MLTLLLALTTPDAHAEDVLLLWDSAAQDTPALVTALETAGISVKLADVPEWEWDGTNPTLDGIGTVIHLDGAESTGSEPDAWAAPMPTAGQEALVAFVEGGGGFIHQEWLAYESGSHAAMTNIVLLTGSGGSEGTLRVDVVAEQKSHPVWTDMPDSYSFAGAYNSGRMAVFGTDPAVAIAVDENGREAVVVRELTGAGRIVGFHHAGNYFAHGTLTDAHIQRLYVNAVNWTNNCDRDGDGEDREGACGGNDCDDSDATVNSGADERCNGVDNDCDGVADSPDPIDGTTYYLDFDDDGYGDPEEPLLACEEPDGYVTDNTDCNDGNADVNPGESEVPYDGVDNDCADGDLCDVDDDGVDADLGSCSGLDCDDDDDTVAPGKAEIWYDGIDQDCDGNDDDQDGDGVPLADDCDDTNAAVHPGVEEVKGDDLDNDCDGKVDGCGCQSGPSGGVWFVPGLLALLAIRRRRG